MFKGEIIIVLVTVLFVMTFLRRLKSAGATIVDRSFLIGFNPFRLTTRIGPGGFHNPTGTHARVTPIGTSAFHSPTGTRARLTRIGPCAFHTPIGGDCCHTGIIPAIAQASHRTGRGPLALCGRLTATTRTVFRGDIPLLFWPPRAVFRFHVYIVLAG
jgi:hypothetical protein